MLLLVSATMAAHLASNVKNSEGNVNAKITLLVDGVKLVKQGITVSLIANLATVHLLRTANRQQVNVFAQLMSLEKDVTNVNHLHTVTIQSSVVKNAIVIL